MVGVADGDTITLLDSQHQQHRIRIGGIDAPEKGQPYSTRSKMNLSNVAFGMDAKVDCYKVDRVGRDVCTVYVSGKHVGLTQLEGTGNMLTSNYRETVSTTRQRRIER